MGWTQPHTTPGVSGSSSYRDATGAGTGSDASAFATSLDLLERAHRWNGQGTEFVSEIAEFLRAHGRLT